MKLSLLFIGYALLNCESPNRFEFHCVYVHTPKIVSILFTRAYVDPNITITIAKKRKNLWNIV